MPISVQVRNVPDELDAVLRAGAKREGTSLRRDVLRVLAEHAELPHGGRMAGKRLSGKVEDEGEP